ncbi:MAG: cation-transporting P-type ATPase, partial [archaeon]
MQKRGLGLTKREAEARLRKYGPNEISEIVPFSAIKILLRQVKGNFMVYLLIVAAILSFLVDKSLTAYTIVAVVVIVIGVSFFQEYKAERAVKELKKMVMPISIAIREGKEVEIPSNQIVPGDILLLRTGERVPADCMVIQERNLQLNEATLTGESKEVGKKATKNTKNYKTENQVFMGTYVVNGKCLARVMHTGMNTEFGKIAGMISTAEKELPLQKKVNHIGKQMTIISIIMSVITGMILLFTNLPATQVLLFDTMVVVIAIAVSAFPEGFPVVLISTLSTGAYKMAKKNAIINRMSIIETLGETTIICTDKTGTITKGEMTVKKILADGKIFDVTGTGYEAKGEIQRDGKKVEFAREGTLKTLYKAAVLCNDAIIQRKGTDKEYNISGSTTEAALMIMAAKENIFREDIESVIKEEIPFTSERKMMTVLSKEKDGYYVYSKGAPEILLKKCNTIQIRGTIYKLGEVEKNNLLKVSKKFTSKTLRMLAIAYKKTEKNIRNEDLEKDLILLGLVAIDDPPREEVEEAIRLCRKAGIKVKMITGDDKQTALAIAKQVGIKGGVITGDELDKITDDELPKIIKNIGIFARVKPEHKLKIVRALKKNGEIVAMTGDGINDAPALREAHIGIAMGKTGTDVSREASDMVLKDDNFVTIVSAIKEGRTIFNNIKKFVSYQLSCNYAELLIIFLGVVLLLPIPLLAIQILFMNLVTDNLPSLTLGFNPASHDIMKVKPRRDSRLVNKQLIKLMVIAAAIISLAVIGLYYYQIKVQNEDVVIARTTALVTLILFEITNAFNFRSFRKPVHKMDLFANKPLIYACIASLLATIAIVYTKANTVFGTAPIGLWHWIIAITISLSIVGI